VVLWLKRCRWPADLDTASIPRGKLEPAPVRGCGRREHRGPMFTSLPARPKPVRARELEP